jgi:hypothetical protein
MIFVTGDTHGTIDYHKLSVEMFPEQTLLTKDDFVIILGDFGGIWTGTKKDNRLLDWYERKPWTTLFIDGNHENFNALYRYPVEEWNGGRIHEIRPSVLHLQRGQVFTIDDHKFFTFGGAMSIDKIWRTEGVSWWPQEIPTRAEVDEALGNLQKHNFEIDAILTHTAPTWVCRKLNAMKLDDPVCVFLDAFDMQCKFKKWFFGHFHVDQVIDHEFIALYNEVVLLDFKKKEDE